MRKKWLTILALLLIGNCSREAEPPASQAEMTAMTTTGDFDGDGAEDRVELWITPAQSRLLIYLAARPGEVSRVYESAGAADYLRTRPASAAPPELNARYDVVSYQTQSGEIITYWDGGVFVTTRIGSRSE